MIHYTPSGAPSVTGLTNPASVEKWSPIEIGFTLNNSAASDPQFPYLAPADRVRGLGWVDGVTADGVFWNAANPAVTYRRPAFLYQAYTRQQHTDTSGCDEWLYPSGTPSWKVRFAPPSTGTWNYNIQVTKARGTASSPTGSFTATAVSDPLNHGPIWPAAKDSRYFEYADGTPFLGNGHNISFTSSWNAASLFNTFGNSNQNFFRWWVSGKMWMSSWDGWRSMTQPSNGNVPYDGRSTEAAYGNGYASMKLDATANPIMGQTGQRATRRSRPGRPTASACAGARRASPAQPTRSTPRGGWPCADSAGSPAPRRLPNAALLVAHQKGDSPWHVSEGTYTVASGVYSLPIGFIMENCTPGSAMWTRSPFARTWAAATTGRISYVRPSSTRRWISIRAAPWPWSPSWAPPRATT